MARHYPAPRLDLIIEPFAGGAGYSMLHLQRSRRSRAILVEKDPRVVELWTRLLGMTCDQVRAIPVPRVGDDTDDFFVMTASTSNGVARSRRMKVSHRMPALVEMMKRRAIRLLPIVRDRVEVVLGDYTSAPDVEACWFVDPPYQPHASKRTSAQTGSPQGMGYAPGCDSSALDFPALCRWCMQRAGQVLVVEQEGADWLPFELVDTRQHDSQNRRKHEVLWSNEPRPVQGRLLV